MTDPKETRYEELRREVSEFRTRNPQFKTRYEELLREVKDFHKRNPQVWKLFEQFTFDRIDKGFRHYSADAIMHRVRWETEAGGIPGQEPFKINNNYVSCYARRFMMRNQLYKGFFRTRTQSSITRRTGE